MVCKQTCKIVCITAYILAALGAILAGINAIRKEQINVPKALNVIYMVGGIVTLVCAVRWMLNKEGQSITV